jgi:hypothetical protein
MFRQEILIALAVLGLILIGLTACKPRERVLTKDQIINQVLLDACDKSDSRTCLFDTFMPRTESYCAEVGLVGDGCLRVKIDVLKQLQDISDKKTQEINRQIEIKTKENQELERQLGR